MTKMKNILVLSLLAVTVFFSGCQSKEDEPVSDTQYDLLDTVCSISIYDIQKDEANKILKGAFELCKNCENMMSRTVEGSDTYNINNSKGEFVEISKDTYEVLKKSLYYAEISDGKFDVTVGKLAALWDFQASEPKVPAQEKISEAIKSINYKNLEIKKENNKYFARLSDDDAMIDLGGIAKGYIADKVTAYLTDSGVKKALINFGGNVVAIGQKQEKKLWKIGIEKPFSEGNEIVGYVEVKDATVVTSGIYERAFEQDGKLYHHILDVNTGYPVDTDVESVSIVTAKGRSVDADALSSICLIIGCRKAIELIESIDGFEAGVILKNGDIITTQSMNLKEYNK
ncbi:MAG: FAD:protein FMN transferase [Eubacteriales bacterium]